MKQFWKRLSGPIKIGLIVGLTGALLTVIGLFTGNFAPLTVRSVLLGILLGGGSWGVVSWAIAAAVVDATSDQGADAASDAAPDVESSAADAVADSVADADE
jgi:type III secretory pathway component EscT